MEHCFMPGEYSLRIDITWRLTFEYKVMLPGTKIPFGQSFFA